MPIAGYRRFRLHRYGKQVAFGTAVTPTRAIGWSGTPSINPNWTDQDEAEVGSVDPTLPPYRTQTDIEESVTGVLAFDDIPAIMGSLVRGGVTATGGPAYTHTHASLSLTATTLDYLTEHFSDDVTQDGMRLRDGIFSRGEFSFGEDLGPWTFSGTLRYGYVDTHVTPVTGLVVGSNLAIVYGADTTLAINDTSGTIGNTVIADAVHSARIAVEWSELDEKRFANGSNSRFALGGWGLAGRRITASFTFAKADTITGAANSETVDWLNADPVNRYLEVLVTSPSIITGSTPYSWSQRFSGTWRTREDGELGGNTTVTLELAGRYDSALTYAYRSSVVNSRSASP